MLTCDPLTAREIEVRLVDARRRTLELVADLDDHELETPRHPIVNPFRWELGHVAWFQERWTLRHLGGRRPIRSDADALFDSGAVAHGVRWDLPLYSRAEVLRFLGDVLECVLERLETVELDDEERYFHELVLFHEDMHGESFLQSRQTLGLREPKVPGGPRTSEAGDCAGDAEIAGGRMLLGADPAQGFVFDNEKWAHPIDVAPFRIARACVTQGAFAAFVEARGYERRELWSEAGWRWRLEAGAEHPLFWRRDAGGAWGRVHFDRTVPLEPHKPVVHVNAHEAAAYCRFVGRRLPSEAEWELAAGGGAGQKALFPWGAGAFEPTLANLDGLHAETLDVGAFPSGDSAHGCRQMLGNVWEWTASALLPYPGFERDPYAEYSEPWFGTHRVLRGGSCATRARLVRNTWRNFFTPDRRDVFAGFRTAVS